MQRGNDALRLSIVQAVYETDCLRVAWSPLELDTPAGWVITLGHQDTGGWTPLKHQFIPDGAATVGVLPLSEPLSAIREYRVTVMALRESGETESSAPLPLPTLQPILHSAIYDGETLRVGWQPSSQALLGYEIVVSSTISGTTFVIPISGAGSASAVVGNSQLGGGLGNDQGWTVGVEAVVRENTRARSELIHFPSCMTPPNLEQSPLYRGGNRIAVAWFSLDPREIVQYQLSLHSALTGTHYDMALPAGYELADLPLSSPLPEFDAFSFTLTALTAKGAGISTKPLRVVADRPDITSVVLDNEGVDVAWNMSNSLEITHYIVQVFSPETAMVAASARVDAPRTHERLSLKAPLRTDKKWVCQVIAYPGSGVGTEGDWVPMVTGTPLVTLLRPRVGVVDVTWSPPESVVAPEGTWVSITRAGNVISQDRVAGCSAQMMIPVFDANLDQSLSVQLTPICGKASSRTQWQAEQTAPAL
ncbi:hypothetical protein ACK3BK_12630 [Pseudomonas sp. L7]|uniref:hypothetical protein n=1 Tax=Pseudomonas sp. L7 TaxID=3388343 RepID=UPI00398518E3